MNISVDVRVIALTLLLCGGTWLAAQPADNFLLSPGRAGRLEVGLPVDTLYRIVGRDNVRLIDLYREGMFEPAVEIRLPGSPVEPAIVAPVREWPCFVFSVQGLEVRDSRFRTKEGLGVGSTLGELQKHYAVRVSDEEGPHAWVEAIKMAFSLENASRAPAVRIRAVWIPGDPVAIRRAKCPDRGALGRGVR